MKRYTIKNSIKHLIIFFLMNLSYKGFSNISNVYNNKKDLVVMDTVKMTAQVWVDKEDVAFYGGEVEFKNKLQKLFENSTKFWNDSPNKFNYYFEFLPADELVLYDKKGDPKNYDLFKDKAFGKLDTQRFDFVLFFALDAEKIGLSCGGGGASGQSVVMAYLPRDIDIFNDAEYPDQGTYSNLAHEYGHVLGAQDLYQYKISAENNSISNQAFVPPACNMGTGYMEWSDYASALFNYTGPKKILEPDLQKKTFPETLRISVYENGKPKNNVKINFYGSRAGGYWGGPDIYVGEGNSPYMQKITNSSGLVLINDVYSLYFPKLDSPGVPPKKPNDEFPWSRWFVFLLEIVDEGKVKYVWLPDLDMRTEYILNRKPVYELTIEL